MGSPRTDEGARYSAAMMRIALCNEVIAPMPFPRQCEYAAKLGYDGLEIAPYTLSDEPHRLGAAQLAAARAAAADAGIAVTGLHWLLVKPAGLSISTRDDAVRRKTVDFMRTLIDRWLPQGVIAHVQVNDRNRQGPGQGEQRFAGVFAALRRHRYAGDVAVEPFDYVPDGPAAAARAIGYVRGIIEALE